MQLPPQLFSEVLTTLKELGDSSGREKRRFTRIQLQARIDAAMLHESGIGRRYTALTRDVSPSGIGLIQEVRIEAGRQILLALPRKKHLVIAIAVAMHSHCLADGLFGVGAEFVGIADPKLAEAFLAGPDADIRHIRSAILGPTPEPSKTP